MLGLLRIGWSPPSIEGLLARDHGGADAGRVSPEAIYQWVYAQPVATLRRETRCAPGARTGAGRARSPRRVSASPATSTNARPRPPGARCRGHWEGDIVVGKGGTIAVAPLVERTSRFLVLVPLTGRDR